MPLKQYSLCAVASTSSVVLGGGVVSLPSAIYGATG